MTQPWEDHALAVGAFTCSAAFRISSDFHEDLQAECERCRMGSGSCLAEIVLEVVEDEEPELAWLLRRRLC